MGKAPDASVPEDARDHSRALERAQAALRELGRIIDATRSAMRIDAASDRQLQRLRDHLGPDAEARFAQLLLEALSMDDPAARPQRLPAPAAGAQGLASRPGRYRPLV
jgi:hypothetical protein